MKPVLIDGHWRSSRSSGSFRAMDPATGSSLAGEYPDSSFDDLESALHAASRLVRDHPRIEPDALAAFLEDFAGRLESRRDEAVETAARETALSREPRLQSVEFPRMTDQIRQAAAACRERTWCRATIDTKLNIRSMFGPLGGPVVIFGPNNFPFAFNAAAGGDFAAAVAAGNPVIAKGHPGHPGTSGILAEAAFDALMASGLPRALFQFVYHFEIDDGLRLAGHPLTGAVAFTGSRASGLRLKEAADRAGKPVYVEMSSANPVVFLPGALEDRAEELAGELFASCTAGAGQFCTKPGLVILVRDSWSERFFEYARGLFARESPGTLLGEGTLLRLSDTVRDLGEAGAALAAGGHPLPGLGFRFANTLFRVTGNSFLRTPGVFQTEAFGSVSVVVFADDEEEMKRVVLSLDGTLTASIYSHRGGADDALYREIEPALRFKAGRLINDRMPTGVALSPAMNHGGPFPATGHPGFTAVGLPASMLRFAALRCYDHVRPERLPPELQDKNPNGVMWRCIDGEWTRRNC